MTKIKNDPSKANLIVVKSELNDKNSESYLKRIRKECKEFSDEMQLIEVTCKNQKDFERVLRSQRGSFLCLEPHNFIAKEEYKHRNVESDHVVDAVLRYLANGYLYEKVLIIGEGRIGTKLKQLLNSDEDRVAISWSARKLEFLPSNIVNTFDAIVNCARYDCKVELFCTKTVFDVAGTFEPKSIEKYEFANKIKNVSTCDPEVISRGDIGKYTTHLMLQEVIANGL